MEITQHKRRSLGERLQGAVGYPGEMGSSDGETIAAPAPSQNGGSRSECRQTAGLRVLPSEPHGVCCRRLRRRERLLDSIALIGQGSDALVYLVRNKLTGRMSALKVGVYAGRSARLRGINATRNGSEQSVLRLVVGSAEVRMWFPAGFFCERERCVKGAPSHILVLVSLQLINGPRALLVLAHTEATFLYFAHRSRRRLARVSGVRCSHPARSLKVLCFTHVTNLHHATQICSHWWGGHSAGGGAWSSS